MSLRWGEIRQIAITVRATDGSIRVGGAAMRAGNLRGGSGLECAHHSPSFASLPFSQITAALPAYECPGWVTTTAETAVDIGAGLRLGDLFFVCDQLLANGLVKFDVIRLGRATGLAKTDRAGIDPIAIGARPL